MDLNLTIHAILNLNSKNGLKYVASMRKRVKKMLVDAAFLILWREMAIDFYHDIQLWFYLKAHPPANFRRLKTQQPLLSDQP